MKAILFSMRLQLNNKVFSSILNTTTYDVHFEFHYVGSRWRRQGKARHQTLLSLFRGRVQIPPGTHALNVLLSTIISGRFDWDFHIPFSDVIIRNLQDNLLGQLVIQHTKLSKPYIRKFQGVLEWLCTSTRQNLYVPFIEEFQQKIDFCSLKFLQCTLGEAFVYSPCRYM